MGIVFAAAVCEESMKPGFRGNSEKYFDIKSNIWVQVDTFSADEFVKGSPAIADSDLYALINSEVWGIFLGFVFLCPFVLTVDCIVIGNET